MDQERILVVEDEEAIRYVLSTYLTEMGCEVHEAGSVEEALPLLEGFPFSLALLDIVLPGMTGLEMLKRIRKAWPDTEVIMMTSHGSLDTATQAIRNGAYGYLIKPFDEIDDVGDTVKKALFKRNLSRDNRRLLLDIEQQNLELSAVVKRRDSLIEAGRAMSAICGLPELLDCFLGLVADELDVDRTSIMLLDAQAKYLSIAASRGLPADVVTETRVKVGEGISGRVVATGEPVLVQDAKSDPKLSDRARPDLSDSFISAPIMMSVPIKGGEKVLGVINITERRSGAPFDDEDVGYIQGLCGQAAVAIENAKHVAELEEAVKTLEETRDHLLVVERLKALGEMAAGVAHDFNNTLNGILMRAQTILAQLESSNPKLSAFRQHALIIEKLSLQGAETVKRIQDFTRIRKDLPQETVEFNTIVKDALEMTRPHWQQEREASDCQIEPVLNLAEVPEIIGSPNELVQVVSNLIFNATEAMPDGGRLTLSTFREEGWVRLEVADTGKGMTKNDRDRVFEPFFTTKDKGQGLGTSIVYGIVNRHGGEVTVRSDLGQGTVFTVRLPVAGSTTNPESQAKPSDSKLTDSKPTDGPARVLIIEDEEQNREIYRLFLEANGYRVFDAEDGKKGLALFESETIDVVVTDLSMPGLSGWEVAKEIKSRAPGTPVILLSGWAVQEDEAKAKQAGVDYVLCKPCPLGQFLAVLETALVNRAA